MQLRLMYLNTHRPLHGLPVLVKDNIATGDDMQTAGTCYTCYLKICRVKEY